jgi:hypothetical protein
MKKRTIVNTFVNTFAAVTLFGTITVFAATSGTNNISENNTFNASNFNVVRLTEQFGRILDDEPSAYELSSTEALYIGVTRLEEMFGTSLDGSNIYMVYNPAIEGSFKTGIVADDGSDFQDLDGSDFQDLRESRFAFPAVWDLFVFPEGAEYRDFTFQYSIGIDAETGEVMGASYHPGFVPNVDVDPNSLGWSIDVRTHQRLSDQQGYDLARYVFDFTDKHPILENEVTRVLVQYVIGDWREAGQYIAVVLASDAYGNLAQLRFRDFFEDEKNLVNVVLRGPFDTRPVSRSPEFDEDFNQIGEIPEPFGWVYR